MLARIEAIKRNCRQIRADLSFLDINALESDPQSQLLGADGMLQLVPSVDSGESADNEKSIGEDRRTTGLKFQLSARVVEGEQRKTTLGKPKVFWSYKFYRDSADQPPIIRTSFDKTNADAEVSHFLKEPVVGLDLEWAYYAKASSGIKKNISLIQIASESRILLIHIARFPGNTVADLLPENLARLLENQRIIKTGVNIGGDCMRLEKHFGVIANGILELSHLHKLVSCFQNPADSRPAVTNKTLVALGDQVIEHLGMPLCKGAVRTSSWHNRLSTEQEEYAASDAYSCYQVYQALEKKRKALNPVPASPVFAEYQTVPGTILVGAGQTIDEFIDGQGIGLSEKPIRPNGVMLKTESSTASVSDMVDETTSQPSQTSQARASSKKSPPCPKAPIHPDIQAAQTWATDCLTKLGPECRKNSKPLTLGHLKAYHLWHSRELDITSIAKIWRDPPLAQSTIAGYIEKAVVWGKLPCDQAKFDIVMNMIPYRYRTKN